MTNAVNEEASPKAREKKPTCTRQTLLHRGQAFHDFPVIYKRETSLFRCFGRRAWREELAYYNLIPRHFSHVKASCGSQEGDTMPSSSGAAKPMKTKAADVYHFTFVLSCIWFHNEQLYTFPTVPMDGSEAKQAKG